MAKYPVSYRVKDRKHIPKTYGTDAVEVGLMERGFRCREKERWLKECERSPELRANQPRFTYRNGDWRVLSPNHDSPWWTIQRWSGSQCEWFVDFPLAVPAERVAWFIGRMEA